MSIYELFAALEQRRIKLLLTDDEQIKISAPKGAMDQPLLSAIKQHKSDIIDRLLANKASSENKIAVTKLQQSQLSYSQKRMWFAHRMEPASAQYNMSHAVKISGAFDVARAEAVISEIIQRHQVLRTVYRDTDDGPIQVVQDAAHLFSMPIIDLQNTPHSQQHAQISQLINQEA
ncbi:condensation domain-containing protein, partial [Pseudoalteromonas umbrosa]|uniref:condensation domain-containing protein n=1 Tax=Pseudoalteromonas umbrosa TaxID=3048489 RepID=UPI0024C2295B